MTLPARFRDCYRTADTPRLAAAYPRLPTASELPSAPPCRSGPRRIAGEVLAGSMGAWVLDVVVRMPGAGRGDVLRALKVRPVSMDTVFARLARNGLIFRSRGAGGVYRYWATSAGKRALQSVDAG